MAKHIHITECPVCGCSDITSYLNCTDYYATKEKFEIIQCKECKFACTQDFPSEETIGHYYDAPNYISHTDTKSGIINRLYHIVRKRALKSKAKLVIKSSQKDSSMLLDIGCGTGYFLNEMKKDHWCVTGIEKDKDARSFAKQKFDLNTHSHDYLFSLPAKNKDVITLWHVLEHIEPLDETMNQMHKVLKDDGTLVIALPNKASKDAQHYKELWAAYDVPRHLWHFSPSDFDLFANKHNFKIEKIVPMYFDGFYISMLSEQNKKTFLGTFVGLIRGGIFFLEALFDKNKASSLIYILKKK